MSGRNGRFTIWSRSGSDGRWTPWLAVLVSALLAMGAVCATAQTPEVAPGSGAGLIEEIAPFGERGERARITSTRRILQEENVAYGFGRTTIQVGDFKLEADRLTIDLITQDVEAEGNVVFTTPQDTIRARAARYNFRRNEGVGYGVEGRSRDVYFRTLWNEAERGASFRVIDERQSLFRGAGVTTCDFPVPHYYVTASEIVLSRDDRIYFRNAVIWLRGVPLLYMPFYTRGLEGSPWSFQFGYNNRQGVFTRLGYRFIHRLRTPDWQNQKRYRTRTHGRADFAVDYFYKSGVGAGVAYGYRFDYERHFGSMLLYGIRDYDRDLPDEEAPPRRWAYRHQHNTMLGRTIWQLNVDQYSDSDVYFDFLDRFSSEDGERGRLFERSTRAAGSYVRRDWLARILYDQRERLARNRYIDFTDPNADDLDFDPDPDFLTDDEDDDQTGIPRNRFATLRDSLNGRVATGMVRVWESNFFSYTQVNAFRSLDAGQNRLLGEDDRFVLGSDVYQSFTNRIRLTERFTWLNTLGGGIGYYDREDAEILPQDRFNSLTGPPYTIDGIRLEDSQTSFLGDGARTNSLRDVEPAYLWGDYTSRLNARFTDTLQGYLKYTYRKGSSGGLGEYYARGGRVEAAEDIYDFRNDYNWLEGLLSYFLLYPNLTIDMRAGQNLKNVDEYWANEAIRYAGIGPTYTNDTGEFRLSASVDYQERQIRDIGSPNEFAQGSIQQTVEASYIPRHGRYWARLRAAGSTKVNQDPVDRAAAELRRFNEENTKVTIAPLLGMKAGPKYALEGTAEYSTELDNWQAFGLILRRDLHDAEIAIFAGLRNNSLEARRRQGDDSDDPRPPIYLEPEIRGSVVFKLPRGAAPIGGVGLRTLQETSTSALTTD